MTDTTEYKKERLSARAPKRALALLSVLAVLALALGACGSTASSSNGGGSGASAQSSSTSTTHFAKTKFVLHAGLAFGAFHHWIWKPFRAGDFKHPFLHKLTLVKAALAGAFTYHELKIALADAQADPTLSKLVAPLTALQARVKGLPSAVRSGDTSSLGSTDSAINAIKGQSASAGQQIQEQVPAAP